MLAVTLLAVVSGALAYVAVEWLDAATAERHAAVAAIEAPRPTEEVPSTPAEDHPDPTPPSRERAETAQVPAAAETFGERDGPLARETASPEVTGALAPSAEPDAPLAEPRAPVLTPPVDEPTPPSLDVPTPPAVEAPRMSGVTEAAPARLAPVASAPEPETSAESDRGERARPAATRRPAAAKPIARLRAEPVKKSAAAALRREREAEAAPPPRKRPAPVPVPEKVAKSAPAKPPVSRKAADTRPRSEPEATGAITTGRPRRARRSAEPDAPAAPEAPREPEGPPSISNLLDALANPEKERARRGTQ